jgi:hypothetical protein
MSTILAPSFFAISNTLLGVLIFGYVIFSLVLFSPGWPRPHAATGPDLKNYNCQAW